ncbi:hypothetical protein C8R43DRAFT_838839, partial [Mycena crocata]
LVAITGNPKALMSYEHYYEDIVFWYGVELIGWTADRFVSPSNLSSSIPVLTTLRDAIQNGDCKWVKLRPSQRKRRAAKWAEDVAAGRATPKERNERSDKGKKR